MVATAIVNKDDDENLALTLKGKKKKNNRKDFISAFDTLKQEYKLLKTMYRYQITGYL